VYNGIFWVSGGKDFSDKMPEVDIFAASQKGFSSKQLKPTLKGRKRITNSASRDIHIGQS